MAPGLITVSLIIALYKFATHIILFTTLLIINSSIGPIIRPTIHRYSLYAAIGVSRSNLYAEVDL